MAEVMSVSREVAASPEAVWALVTDLPRMGEWSPENTGGSWTHGATGPTPGAKFRGTNRNGNRRWSTTVRVTECEPPRTFEFAVTVAGVKVARWRYGIEPSATGCRVEETWTDERGYVAKRLGSLVSGVDDRETSNRTGMERTLEGLASAAEAES